VASFIPVYSSAVPISEQWNRHLQQQEYVNDVTQSIERSIEAYNDRAASTEAALRENTEVVTAAIGDLSDATVEAALAQIENARQNAASIVGAVYTGSLRIAAAVESSTERVATSIKTLEQNVTGTIEAGSQKAADQIRELGAGLDYRLNAIIDQGRVANMLSLNIAELLRVPDFQKERIYYLQQGFKHYQNAAIDPALYENALENLLKAEEREKTDYVVLHRLGMIYLYSRQHCDLDKAENYFERAGRFASIESEPSAIRLARLLTGDVGRDLTDQNADATQLKQLAADSYIQAAFAAHLRNDLPRALQHARRANQLSPESIAAKFTFGKYLAICGEREEATSALKGVMLSNRHYAVVVADDTDLAPRHEIQALLEELRLDSESRLTSALKEVENTAPSLVKAGGSLHSDYIKATQCHQRRGYLRLLEGLDIITPLHEQALAWKTAVSKSTAILSKIEASGASFVRSDHDFYRELTTATALLSAADTVSAQDCLKRLVRVDLRVSRWMRATTAIYETLQSLQSADVFKQELSQLHSQLLSCATWEDARAILNSLPSSVQNFDISNEPIVRIAKAFSPSFTADGKLVLVGVWDNDKRQHLELWDVTTNAIVQKLEVGGKIDDVVLSPKGKFATCSVYEEDYFRQEIFIWDAQSGELLHRLNTYLRMYHVYFSPNELTLVAKGYRDDKDSFQVWNVAKGERIVTWDSVEYSSVNFAFSRDGSILFFGGHDKGLEFFRCDSVDEEHRRLSGRQKVASLPNVVINNFEFSPDGKHVVLDVKDENASGYRRHLALYDFQTGQFIRRLSPDGESLFYSFVFSTDGCYLVEQLKSGLYSLVVDDPEAKRRVAGPLEKAFAQEFWHDGPLLLYMATISDELKTFLLNVASGTVLKTFAKGCSPKFSPNGSAIAFGMHHGPGDQEVLIFEIGADISLDMNTFARVRRGHLALETEGRRRQMDADTKRARADTEVKEKQARLAVGETLFRQAKGEIELQNSKVFFRNYSRARQLLQEAAARGHNDAMHLLNSLRGK
jgi:WD40 repeat protein/tetratricopeptide (TPR) repeat protein